jgi:DNA-binding CsgD family transcriptional regulator
MKTSPMVDAKGQQLLELLSEGASTATLARKLGYSPGTVRVYLHNLYRVIGVRNRTEAVLWHLNRVRPAQGSPIARPAAASLADETFGEAALRDGLLGALGVMESFIGPYGRVWEVGLRLKGEPMEESAMAFRDDTRLLWRALLQGNFGYGKAVHEESAAERLISEAPSDAVLLATLLIVGGYSHAADACVSRLGRARKGGRSLSGRELNYLKALKTAVYDTDADAGEALSQIAGDKATPTVLRHVAVAALYHAYRAHRDFTRAAETANVLWAEAETARQQLEAMGVRPLARDVALPKAARPAPARSRRARKSRRAASARPPRRLSPRNRRVATAADQDHFQVLQGPDLVLRGFDEVVLRGVADHFEGGLFHFWLL